MKKNRYCLILALVALIFFVPRDCSSKRGPSITPQVVASQPTTPESAGKWSEQTIRCTMELLYADQSSVDHYDDNYVMITIKDNRHYLVVPKDREPWEGLPDDVTVIRQSLKNIYLAATSAMDLFRSLDSVNRITLSGTDASGWYTREAGKAMEEGRMLFAGKYSAPDYGRILSGSRDPAVESTMIYHSLEVKEQLEELGIPALVERSSYKNHPLGQMEWVRLYGTMLGREELTESCFKEQVEHLQPVMDQEETSKTVVFFYISSNGYVNTRKSGDYVARMIDLVGGIYVPQDLDEHRNALSTMNMQVEAFYAAVKDADCPTYNSTIDGELRLLGELLDKSSLLVDFKAVKEGSVWCTGKNLFQKTVGLGDMILDIHRILTEDESKPQEMNYTRRLE